VKKDKGQSIATDPKAISAEPGVPAFVARPSGAPVYYGFPVLDDIEVDGFKFGVICDFEAEQMEYGDAFIVAPDDSRAGLVWEVFDEPYFREVIGLEDSRWGVWAVSFQYPMRTPKMPRTISNESFLS
jgi:hypothetical protein